MRRLIDALDRYWFTPGSLRDLALVRILAFGTQTLASLVGPPGFLHTLPEQLNQAAAGATFYEPIPALKALLLPWGSWGGVQPGATFLTVTFGVAIVAGMLATIGLYARVAMLCAAAANTLLIAHWYSYGEYHHAEGLIIIALNVLAVAPCAAVWSVDSARRRSRSLGPPSSTVPAGDASVFARWPLRLMQWMIAITYLSGAVAKLNNGGLSWLNGHTATYNFAAVGVGAEREVAFFLATLPPELHVVPSALALLFELTFVVAVLVPRTAWFYVLAGIGFHTGVYLTMGIVFFQTMVLYCVFVESLRLYAPIALRPGWKYRLISCRPSES